MNDTMTFIKFKKKGKIGGDEGQNSDVFLADDEQLGNELVIKQIEKSKFNQEDYFMEAHMMYASKHPNVVEIQYASQDDEYIYLAMPYYKNGSLNSLMEEKFLSVREIIKYSLDLLSGISFIHSKKLLHLDIKPTNILINNEGKAVIADFGLSRYTDDNGIAEQQAFYMKHVDPERCKHSARTVQSDIYQIGLTMYRLCNGNANFLEQYNDKITGQKLSLEDAVKTGCFPDRQMFLPHIPKELQKVILKALNVDTNLRYSNTIEMMNAISIIDSNLDWIYTGDDCHPYYKYAGEYYFEVEVCDCGKNIISTKTNLCSKRKTRVHDCCLICDTGKGGVAKTLAEVLCTL